MKNLKIVNRYSTVDGEIYVNGISTKQYKGLLSGYEEKMLQSQNAPESLEFSMNSLGLEFSKLSSIHHIFCPIYVQKGVLVLDVRELHRKHLLSEYLKSKFSETLDEFKEDMGAYSSELLWR